MKPRIPLGFRRRLLISYVILVVSAVAVSGGLVASFFQNRYEEKLRQIQTGVMRSLAAQFHEMFVSRVLGLEQTLSAAYITPPNPFFAMDDQGSADLLKIQGTYRWLTALVYQNRAGVGAIHLYYPQTKLTVSSRWGVYFEPEDRPGKGASWVSLLQKEQTSSLWTFSELTLAPGLPESPGEKNPVAFFSFPPGVGPAQAGLIIAVDLEPAQLSGFLTQAVGTGDTLSLLPKSPTREGGQFLEGAFLVTEVPLDDTGWVLSGRIPQEVLGRDWVTLMVAAAIICLSAVGAALVLALFFSTRLSRPLGQLVQKIQRLGKTVPVPGNEYSQIHGVLDNLMDLNQSVLKQELVQLLVEGADIFNDRAGEERFSLLDLPQATFDLRCVWVQWRVDEAGGADLRHRSLYRFRLVQELSSLAGDWVLASALSWDTAAFVVPSAFFQDRVGQLQSWLAQESHQWGCRIRLLVSGEFSGLSPASTHFQSLKKKLPWFFFFSETVLLWAEELELHRQGRFLPARLMDPWQEALRRRDSGAVQVFWQSLARQLAHGDWDLSQCEKAQTGVRRILQEELAAQGMGSAEDSILEGFFHGAWNFCDWGNLLVPYLRSHWGTGGESVADRQTQTIQAVRQFVENNLGQDLSLATVSRAVGISEGYLSSLFKESTGDTFVGFVTERRLQAARILLSTTPDTAQNIAFQVGFRTPAYFIQLFKRRFGHTPADFRRHRTLGNI